MKKLSLEFFASTVAKLGDQPLHGHRPVPWSVFLILALGLLIGGCVKCVKFDTLPPDTVWGTSAGHSSGDVVHTEDSIQVSVVDHVWSDGRTHFGETRMKPSWTVQGGNAVFSGNINLSFDFGNLNFTPNEVELLFADWGGQENISVNGSPMVTTDLQSGSGGGATWTVVDEPYPDNPSNRMGVLQVTGNIQTLVIGGQEFLIDKVCAKR